MTIPELADASDETHRRAIHEEAKRHISDGRLTPEQRAAAHVYASEERSFYCHTCRATRHIGYPSTAACFNASHLITT